MTSIAISESKVLSQLPFICKWLIIGNNDGCGSLTIWDTKSDFLNHKVLLKAILKNLMRWDNARARLVKWLIGYYVFIGFSDSGMYIIIVVCKWYERITFPRVISPFISRQMWLCLFFNSYSLSHIFSLCSFIIFLKLNLREIDKWMLMYGSTINLLNIKIQY